MTQQLPDIKESMCQSHWESLIADLESAAIAHRAAVQSGNEPAALRLLSRLLCCRASLLAHIAASENAIVQLRASVDRIGHERELMIAANVQLQERLSRFSNLEDDLK